MLAGYDVISVLHEAEAIRVTRCARQSDNLRVVVKMALEPAQHARLKYEFSLLQTLQQADARNVPLPVELVARSGEVAIVTQDLGGLALRALQHQGPFTITEALHVAMGVCRALMHVHRAGMVHKDVNPNNIVYNRDSGDVQLIDFGIATPIAYEAQSLDNLSAIEGTLGYISPEQTGRMNRLLDYRTDFYSLGVTLYEMLTRTRPFKHTDPSQQVHAILARPPRPPRTLVPTLPQPINDVVMRLLEKNPDARYQSARGLLHDLHLCQQSWDVRQDIPAFTLGSRDASERFEIPQDLYGREAEVERLATAYERTVQGGHALVLVPGPSGIGKSALVHEVQRLIVQRQGLFMTGKHEELRRHIPFVALGQAINGLVRRLLSDREEQVQVWRLRLRQALGALGQAVIDIAPGVENLLGPQPALPPLPATANENRLIFALQQLFATLHEHQPVVLFLDDLQWADGCTLRFLEHVAASAPAPGSHGLLLIGAYRDTEVDPAHPLSRMLGRLEQAPSPPLVLPVGAIHEADVSRLVAAATRNAPTDTESLAALVHFKTGGNPFFVREYLKALHAQGLLSYNAERNAWTWDIHAVRAATLGDDVLSLLHNKLAARPAEEGHLLSLAACLGNTFRLLELSALAQSSRRDTLQRLRHAVISGWIIPVSGTYRYAEETEEDLVCKFAHDRVHQAAYSLLSTEQAVQVHHRISERLLTQLDHAASEDRLFETLEHLNTARALITDAEARQQLAELNLLGGRQAKRAAAYELAEEYSALSLQLLPADAWQSQYATIRQVQLQLADCEFLTGKAEAAEARLDTVLAHCRDGAERAAVYERRAECQTTLSNYRGAVDFSAQALRDLGLAFNPHPGKLTVLAALLHLQATVRGRHLETLMANAPPLTDTRWLRIMHILYSMVVAAYFANPTLYAYVVLLMGRITITHGRSEFAPFSMGSLSAIYAAMNQPRQAQRYAAACRVMASTPHATYPMRRALITTYVSIEYAQLTAMELADRFHAIAIDAMENGDLNMAGNVSMCDLDATLLVSLRETLQRLRLYQRLASLSNREVPAWYRVIGQLSRMLLGQTQRPDTFDGADFNEAQFLARYEQPGSSRVGLATFHFNKMFGLYVHGYCEAAVQHGMLSVREGVLVNHGEQVAFYFGSVLLLAMTQHALSRGARRVAEPKLFHRLQRKFAKTAAVQPGVVAGMSQLLQAETAAMHHRPQEAGRLYIESLRWLERSGYIGFWALGTECLQRHYERLGWHDDANQTRAQALALHRQWGTTHRIAMLEAQTTLLAARPVH